MTWKKNVLVVANVTATSDELVQALRDRAASQPTSFMLIVPRAPGDGSHTTAEHHLEDAVEHLRAAGLDVSGAVGDVDPMVAVSEVWDPKQHDEIVVSTLPLSSSKWLHAGLPERIGKLTGATVIHVVAHPPKPEMRTEPAPPHDSRGLVLGPLSVMEWGSGK